MRRGRRRLRNGPVGRAAEAAGRGRPAPAAALASTGASMADLRSTLDLRSLNVPVTPLMGSVNVDLTSLIWSVTSPRPNSVLRGLGRLAELAHALAQ